jgi:hypothetical protein
MNQIRMLRLKTGEDIIGTVLDDGNGLYHINEPMEVSIEHKGKNTGIVMSYWLPVQIVKYNAASLKYTDILTIIDPNDALVEYYETTVEKFHEILKAKEMADAMTDEEMSEALESIQADKDTRVH